MSDPGNERGEIRAAIEWRAKLELTLTSALAELEPVSRSLPLSLERTQLRSAVKALDRVHATCVDTIAEGQRILKQTEVIDGATGT